MGPQFFETPMGRKFYGSQFPKMIRALERIACALESLNSPIRIDTCVEDVVLEGHLAFQKGKKYILIPAEKGYYDVFDMETGAKTMCTWIDMDGCFASACVKGEAHEKN